MSLIDKAEVSRAPEIELSKKDFRHAMGHFPTGITVISTADEHGKPYGATVSSFASLSLDPPLIQWSLTTSSYSYPIFSQATHFAVNILAEDQEDVSKTFCQPIDRFAHVKSSRGVEGVPLVHGCVGWIECSVEQQIEVGDHTIFIGRVLRTIVDDKPPLLHWRGTYHAIEVNAAS